MSRPLPAPKSDFLHFADDLVHLATGGEPPLLKVHHDAFGRFAADKAGGFDGYYRHWQVADRVRRKVADLIGLDSTEIGFLGNASEGIERVVSSFDWRAGDNVVVPALDYASGRFALADLERRGVTLRIVEPRGWRCGARDILERCDHSTRLVYVSQVNALTGEHVDIEVLSQGLSGTRTALLVDVSHALGVVPVRAELADFVVSCTYKFLLGIHEGLFAWNRTRWPDFHPASVGWWSAEHGEKPGAFTLKKGAERVEYGNAGHLGIYLLEASLDYLAAFPGDAVAAHVRSLSGRMVEGMAALGLDVMTPGEPGKRAASAAFAHADAVAIMNRLKAENILVWSDNGRLRASAHVFTTQDDVERFLERISALIG